MKSSQLRHQSSSSRTKSRQEPFRQFYVVCSVEIVELGRETVALATNYQETGGNIVYCILKILLLLLLAGGGELFQLEVITTHNDVGKDSLNSGEKEDYWIRDRFRSTIVNHLLFFVGINIVQKGGQHKTK